MFDIKVYENLELTIWTIGTQHDRERGGEGVEGRGDRCIFNDWGCGKSKVYVWSLVIVVTSRLTLTLQWSCSENPRVATFQRQFGYTDGEFSMANSPYPHIIFLEETGASGANPRRHGDNVQTPHRQWPKAGIEPGSLVLWGSSANHCATVLHQLPPQYPLPLSRQTIFLLSSTFRLKHHTP